MHPRVDLRTGSRKILLLGITVLVLLVPFWEQFSIIFHQISKKWHPEKHPKINAQKIWKINAKSLQHHAKIDAKIGDVHVFSKKAKMHETIVFTIENVVLGIQTA